MAQNSQSDPTPQEVSDYKQGTEDSKQGVFSTVFNDITVNHPNSDAYYAGRNHEPLNAAPKR
jgi:hypothetical protein